MLINQKNMKIAIGADHAGFAYKEKIKEFLISKGVEIEDFGTFSTDSVDYPDFAHLTAEAVENNKVNFGIVICGSGQGVNITANKHQAVRSALCWNTDVTRLSRQHNNANVLALSARFIALDYALQIVEVFLSTEFEGGRHQNRVEKISC